MALKFVGAEGAEVSIVTLAFATDDMFPAASSAQAERV